MLRALFIGLSTSKSLRSFAEKSPVGRKMSRRFVAGEQLPDAVAATEAVNKLGIRVSIDNLGENVTNPDEARESAKLYHGMLGEIHARGLDANISLKLTHMGLDVDEGLCHELVSGLIDHAVQINNFVRVDMEGSAYTQRTLDFVKQQHKLAGHDKRVGTVLQSYMRRSVSDAEDLISNGIRIRLCKGAYKEPPEIAYQAKSEVDANFVKLTKMLIKSGVFHGIATHDEAILNETVRFARAERIPPEAFEFQMLYGIRRDLQQKLVKDGWGMRVYIPFGTEWYPYLMRRLAERPANALFIAKNLFRS